MSVIWNPPLRSANPVAFCLPLTSAGWGHPALHPTEKGNVGRPALWPPCPLPATANLPCNPPTLTPQTKASLVKGRCRACEAEGFLPVRGCDSAQGIARQNPSGRLRRPPAPLLALRATSPGTGESVFDKGGFYRYLSIRHASRPFVISPWIRVDTRSMRAAGSSFMPVRTHSSVRPTKAYL